MSRHRNVRNYAYEDDMSEDVYGHSVEDHDMCVSPSTAHQFMYNRGNEDQKHNMFANYMESRFGSVEEEEEQEEQQSEEEDHLSHSHDYRRPQLDPISQAKLSSCLDQLQSILGDDCHEPTAVDAILKYDFDAEKALDYIFSQESSKVSKTKPLKESDCNSSSSLLDKTTSTDADPLVRIHLHSLQQPNKPLEDPNDINNSLALAPLIKEEKSATSPIQESSLFSLSLGSISQQIPRKHSPVFSKSPLLGPSLKDLATGVPSTTRGSIGLSQNPCLGPSLKDLATGMPSTTRGSIGLSQNPCLGPSLKDLADMSLTSGSDHPESTIFMTSLSSLASENASMSGVEISSSTPLAMLAGEVSTQSNPKCRELSESHVLKTSLSSLANPNNSKDQYFCPSGMPLETLAKQAPSLSSSTGKDTNNQTLLETPLSNLSIHGGCIPILQKSEDALKPKKQSKFPKSKGAELLEKTKHTSGFGKKAKNKRLQLKSLQRTLSTADPSMFALTLCCSVKKETK